MYYSYEKILATKDLDGDKPSIYIITNNRSAGKTTGGLKLLLEDYKKNCSEFVIEYRHKYEIQYAHEIFAGVLNMYPDLGQEMTIKTLVRDTIMGLYLDGERVGYSLALSSADSLKKYSPIFAKVENVLMDEYQTESGKYLPKEFELYQSVALSIARGNGEQSRYVRFFLLGNTISIMNPYFINFGIHKRLDSRTNIMRGHGWVADFGFNKSASEAIKKNVLTKAFEDSEYIRASTEQTYLIDGTAFIQKPRGNSFTYLFNIQYGATIIAVREYYNEGFIYISKKADPSYIMCFAFKPKDHTQNTMVLSQGTFAFKAIRDAYNGGYLRFDDLETKNIIFDILAIDLYR